MHVNGQDFETQPLSETQVEDAVAAALEPPPIHQTHKRQYFAGPAFAEKMEARLIVYTVRP